MGGILPAPASLVLRDRNGEAAAGTGFHDVEPRAGDLELDRHRGVRVIEARQDAAQIHDEVVEYALRERTGRFRTTARPGRASRRGTAARPAPALPAASTRTIAARSRAVELDRAQRVCAPPGIQRVHVAEGDEEAQQHHGREVYPDAAHPVHRQARPEGGIVELADDRLDEDRRDVKSRTAATAATANGTQRGARRVRDVAGHRQAQEQQQDRN